MIHTPDDASARLQLPYLAAGQMQKHVTLNEALTRLDGLVQASVASRTQQVEPGDPPDGSLWLTPSGATGPAWGALGAGDLVRFDAGAWSVIEAPEGMVIHIADEGRVLVRHQASWRNLGDLLGEIAQLERLGLNTAADAANPFVAKLNNALWTALGAGEGGDGDLRIVFNKEGAGGILSLLFQSAWGGRAELGLIGDENLSLKVSSDGSAWSEAFAVDRVTGRTSFARGVVRSATAIFTAGGSYVVPPWAQRLHLVCVGAGGGGGSGGAGTAAANRSGGGGGGAGGVTHVQLDAADLGAVLTIVVGVGADGGDPVSGSANGNPGADGVASQVLDDGVWLLEATGGAGGSGGAASGPGGGGGRSNLGRANSGGDGLATSDGLPGDTESSPAGAGGGGGGGGLDASGLQRSGGAGGHGYIIGQVSRRASGGESGAAGAAGGAGADKAWPQGFGGGGGGGGSGPDDGSAPGGVGGDGGSPGGGGGGGGGGRDTAASGGGGRGGDGEVRITAIG